MQPEVEFDEPDIIISPWLFAAVAFFIAWAVLGVYVVDNPGIQQHLMRSVRMTVEQRAYFNLRWATLALPLWPSVVAVAAVVLVWVAFLRAEWSDRMLFSAAAILSSTVLLGGTDEVIYRLFHHWYGSTMVSASVTAYVLLLLISHHARKPIPAVLSILAIVYALFLPYYAMFDSLLDIAGGVLFAAAVLSLSFFIAERAGVRPFAASE